MFTRYAAAVLVCCASGYVERINIDRTSEWSSAISMNERDRRSLRFVAVGAVDGLITDSELIPIASASIRVVGTTIEVQTPASGRFRVSKLPVGEYRLQVRRLGYEALVVPVEVRANDTTRVAIAMDRAVLELDTLRARAQSQPDRLAGFLDRRERSVGGKFVTRSDIERQGPVATTDLLRRISGLNIADSSGTLVAISSRGSKMAIVANHLVPVQCTMPVMVDGHRMDSQFALNSIPPDQIFGIEIYPGPSSIPVEFNQTVTDTFCGLIVIWTRSGN